MFEPWPKARYIIHRECLSRFAVYSAVLCVWSALLLLRVHCRQQSATSQSGNRVFTSLGNSGLCWTVFARNRDTAVSAEGNGDIQTLICVLVARPRRCPTLSNPVPWQNWMTAYLGYTLRMKTLFRGWPVMVHDTHTRRRISEVWPALSDNSVT